MKNLVKIGQIWNEKQLKKIENVSMLKTILEKTNISVGRNHFPQETNTSLILLASIQARMEKIHLQENITRLADIIVVKINTTLPVPGITGKCLLIYCLVHINNIFCLTAVGIKIKTDITRPVRVQIVIQSHQKVLHQKIKTVIRVHLLRSVVAKKATTDTNRKNPRSKRSVVAYFICVFLVVLSNVHCF